MYRGCNDDILLETELMIQCVDEFAYVVMNSDGS